MRNNKIFVGLRKINFCTRMASVVNWVELENSRRAFVLYRKALKFIESRYRRREGSLQKQMMLRNEFEENRHETDAQKIEFLFQRAEYWMEFVKTSAQPKIPIHSPGGSSFLRNSEMPKQVCLF